MWLINYRVEFAPQRRRCQPGPPKRARQLPATQPGDRVPGGPSGPRCDTLPPMKVYISVDMEGVAGIVDWAQCIADGEDYGLGRELLIGEVNAAIEGATDAGATAIRVNDAHSVMRNRRPGRLPVRPVQAPLHDGGARRVVRRRDLPRLPRGDGHARGAVAHVQPARDLE